MLKELWPDSVNWIIVVTYTCKKERKNAVVLVVNRSGTRLTHSILLVNNTYKINSLL